MLKRMILWVTTKFAPKQYERFLVHSVLHHDFIDIDNIPVYETREELWDDALDRLIGVDEPITYVEFGVFEGYSIRHFASKNTNMESRFIGLDSFEGLPEDWGGMKKGSFDVGGHIPVVNDPRVSFIKGWFQLVWDELETKMRSKPLGRLVVHYDADLYSSTLFALSQMDRFKVPYIAIFDEFTGHETRALYNYCQAYGATAEFFGNTLLENTPCQLTCRITPMRSA